MTTSKKPSATARVRKTKTDQLIHILGLKSGGDVKSLGDRLGWQPHTIRAAITRLRKVGYEIATERYRDGRPTRYRIVAHPAPAN